MREQTAAVDRLDLLPVEHDHGELQQFLERWKVKRLALFGSALSEDFSPESDIDLLVSFTDDEDWSLFDIFEMEEQLEELLGREVDLVEREVIERSSNFIRKELIFESETALYKIQ